MKLILNNSTIEFRTRILTPVSVNSVLNTPTSFYVSPDGNSILAGGRPYANILYVNIYAVNANANYVIKSDEDWNTNGTSELNNNVSISFGTNLLTGEGVIQDAHKITDINTKTSEAFEIQFTPTQDGYIYITEYNKAPVKCLSSLYK